MLKVVGASWLQTVASFLIVVGILIFGILIIIICRTQNNEDDGKYAASVIWNSETKRYDIVLLGQNNNPEEVRLGIARAYYQPNMQETGWAVLEIESNAQYSDEEQAYASGILEGGLSWQHIYWQWKNTVEHVCTEKNEFCAELRSFLKQNTEAVRKKAKANDKSDAFWHQVNLFYTQLEGIEFGWRYEVRRNKQSFHIPSLDFLWLNIVSDLKDFQKLAFSSDGSTYSHSPAAMSLLKLISKNETKFLLAHASSGFYSSMLRIQKKYNFNYHMTGKPNTELVPGRTISFTSYPGSIHSQDDFYQIQINDESTTTVVGTALLTLDFKDEYNEMSHQVLLGPRVMAGNRLSKNGKTWAYYVGKHNSGTGNKQWLHIQTKNNNLTLWVLEQTPQKITSKEETNVLRTQGYWINCGIPYYSKENTDEKKIDSSEISQHHAGNVPLKNIMQVLREGQANVSNVQSLVDLMRGPELALAGRADLHNTVTFHPIEYSTNSNKSNNEPLRQLPSHNDKQNTKFPYGFKNHKVLNFGPSDQRNFTVKYDSSWHNLLNLKNQVSILSSPTEKENTERGKASLRHNQIFQHTKKLTKNLYGTMNNSYRKRSDINSKGDLQSGKASPLRTIDGIIDLKLTNSNQKFLAAAGPPYNLQNKMRTIQPFQWSKSSIKYLPHDGHSDIWKYDPVEANFVWL